jgi:NAD(P)-dependent dehydrogenase (short-subunit alcohol dehydrogenase family)
VARNGISLVVGVGPGLGAALARCFADAGMEVAVAARDCRKLKGLVDEVEARGLRSRAFDCDVTDEKDVATLFERVEADLGRPELVVYNAGAFVPAGIMEIAAADFERCWRVGCFGGFLVGQAAARRMTAPTRGGVPGGTIVFTGATASLRGGARFANLAVGKFGLRALAQSMARELGPSGVHVAHVIVDGIIASARSGGQTAEESRLDPDAIAANYLMLHRQPRSAWTHELDLRPWVEKF